MPISLIRRLWFSSRKLRLNVPRSALVLEVGSGDSPCPRSDVLFDMSLEGHERVGGNTIHDRPLVLGHVEKLPFKDKAFDYVIAFHVLEHSRDPARFLSELSRVAKAGYIETPSLWAERVVPLTMHRLEVGLETSGSGQRLLIRKKAEAIPDPVLAQQFQPLIARRLGLPRLHPEAWVTRYAWEGDIEYRILNPDEEIAWETPGADAAPKSVNPRSLPRRFAMNAIRRLTSKRNIDVASLLQCPDCGAGSLSASGDCLTCAECAAVFPVTNGIPRLFPNEKPRAKSRSGKARP